MLRMTHETMRGGGGSPWVAITSGPGNYDVVMGAGTDRILGGGDMVWMDSGCTVSGMWSDYGRAGVIGGPSPEQTEAQRLVREIVDEGVAMVRPGVRTSEIAKRLNDRVNNLPLPVTSYISTIAGRVGHGIGLDLTEPPHLSEADPTVLQPGMVISIEPGSSHRLRHLPHRGERHRDAIRPRRDLGCTMAAGNTDGIAARGHAHHPQVRENLRTMIVKWSMGVRSPLQPGKPGRFCW